MTKKEKTISYIAIGSLVAAGVGVYHLIKKRQNKSIDASELIDKYNDNHNNSQIKFSNIEPIDMTKRNYYELGKMKKKEK